MVRINIKMNKGTSKTFDSEDQLCFVKKKSNNWNINILESKMKETKKKKKKNKGTKDRVR